MRSSNEDCYLIHAPLFAVADGVGGVAGGEIASAMAVDVLSEGVGVPSTRLVSLFHRAHGLIRARATNGAQSQRMGTTLTALVIEGGVARVAHTGDSRAYLYRQNRLELLTRDHTRVQEMLDAGTITPEQARVHPHRHVVTSALGASEDVRVDEVTFPLRDDDRILLCTDGVYGALDGAEISTTLGTFPDPGAASERLVQQANAAAGDDNATAVVVDVGAVGDSTDPADAGWGSDLRAWARIASVAAAVVLTLWVGVGLWPSGGGSQRERATSRRDPVAAFLPPSATVVQSTATDVDGEGRDDLVVEWVDRTHGFTSVDVLAISPSGIRRVFHAGPDAIGFSGIRPRQAVSYLGPVRLPGLTVDALLVVTADRARGERSRLRIVGFRRGRPVALLDERFPESIEVVAHSSGVIVLRAGRSGEVTYVVRYDPVSRRIQVVPDAASDRSASSNPSEQTSGAASSHSPSPGKARAESRD